MTTADEPQDTVPRAASRSDDFPFYDGRPVRLGAGQWCFVLAMCVVGFLLLTLPPPFFRGTWPSFAPAILFPVLPLLGLRIVAGRHWRSLFRPLPLRHILLGIGIGLLNLVATVLLGFVVVATHGATANAAVAALADLPPGDRVIFFLRTAPQLFGEEVVTILPLLAILTFLHGTARMSRRTAIVGAWLGSAALFGMLHLPTYEWDWFQCLVLIGCARLILSLGYLWTKNILVCTISHITNDWAMFALTLLGASVGAAAGAG